MKKGVLLFLLLITAGYCRAQVIKGKITDADNGKPIANANVYLNGTYKGTTSDKDGLFTLNSAETNIPLTVSYIGYETQTLTSYGSKEVAIALKRKAIQLHEVTVGAGAMSREEEMRIFLKEFIGSTNKDCVISNPDDIYFSYHKSTQLLTAGTDKPLVIQNKKLGYRITYFLDEFSNQANATVFTGNYFFAEDTAGLKPKEIKNILKARDEAYYGSRMHFIRSLWADKLKENHFSLDDGFTYKDIITNLHGKKFIALTMPLKINGKSTILMRSVQIGINYKSQESTLRQIENDVESFITANGIYETDLVWGGEMGEERVNKLLPVEFEPTNR